MRPISTRVSKIGLYGIGLFVPGYAPTICFSTLVSRPQLLNNAMLRYIDESYNTGFLFFMNDSYTLGAL